MTETGNMIIRALNRIWRLGLVAAALWTGPATAQTSPPGNPSAVPPGQFSFFVCNKTGMTFYFAFIYRKTAADLQYWAHAWWPSTPGSCQSAGNFAQGRFYYFAYNFVGDTRNVIEGTAVMKCLPAGTGGFDQVIADDVQCDPFPANPPFPTAGTYLEGFAELIIPETTSEYDCNLTSPQMRECL